MDDLSGALLQAFIKIITYDYDLWSIILLSLYVSLQALLYGSIIGLSLAGYLAFKQFKGKNIIIILCNSLMGLPPVVVGLVIYIMLSRSGPLGVLELLYTPAAMIIAQTILITPIIIGLSYRILDSAAKQYHDILWSLRLSPLRIFIYLLYEMRLMILTVIITGFGRAIAEVGAVMIVGGNIYHHTRVLTTAIALETSKGNLAFALALGIILLCLSLTINIVVSSLQLYTKKDII